MYIDVVPNRNSPPAVLLREGWRERKKTRKRTLANLCMLPPEGVDALRRALRGEVLVPAGEAFEILRARPHGHVAAVLATLTRNRIRVAPSTVTFDQLARPTAVQQRALELLQVSTR